MEPVDSPVAQVSQAVSQCGSAYVEGIDVYQGTGAIDWAKVAGSGRQFAFIKATQGDYDTQSTFVANWSGSRAAGVLRSPYHFFDGTVDGVAQANAFLAELDTAGGLAPGDLPPTLDLECPTAAAESAANPNCEYTGHSGWVEPATLAQRVYDWLDTVKTATGMTPIVYSYASWFGTMSMTDAAMTSYPLYIASPGNSCATVPAPWTSAAFWQYSDATTVPGIAAPADVDRFFGTIDELEGLARGSDSGLPVATFGAPTVVGSGAPGDGEGGCSTTGGGGSAWWLTGLAAITARRRRRPRGH